MPEGFESVAAGDTRLGDQDARRRRGGATEGLGASRESGRGRGPDREGLGPVKRDRKSTRLNSSHRCISYAVFCLKKKKPTTLQYRAQSNRTGTSVTASGCPR